MINHNERIWMFKYSKKYLKRHCSHPSNRPLHFSFLFDEFCALFHLHMASDVVAFATTQIYILQSNFRQKQQKKALHVSHAHENVWCLLEQVAFFIVLVSELRFIKSQ